MNYNGKKFRPVYNTPNGITSQDTLFVYRQQGNVVTSEYAGGDIRYGHLLGIVEPGGSITMRYHQINIDGSLVAGECISTPEVLANGKVRLHEKWRWTSGDRSEGTSIIEEQ